MLNATPRIPTTVPPTRVAARWEGAKSDAISPRRVRKALLAVFLNRSLSFS